MTTQSSPTGSPNQASTMSGAQIVGLHNSALQSGALLEEGLKRLEEDYRGEPEVAYDILWKLSQGVELLVKLTLQLAGEPVARNHDIPDLLDRLLAAVAADAMPTGRHEFLKRDKRFRTLIEILGKFGGPGKYSSLDAAIGGATPKAGQQSAAELWEEMKLDLVDEDWFKLMQSEPARFVDEYYPHLYRVVATSLAVGVHSLWWLWVHGSTAERGRQWHPSLTGAAWGRVNDLAMRSGPQHSPHDCTQGRPGSPSP